MNLTNNKTLELLQQRARNWDRWAQVQNEHNELEGELKRIILLQESPNVKAYGEFDSFPEESKMTFEAIKELITNSDRVKVDIRKKGTALQENEEEETKIKSAIQSLKSTIANREQQIEKLRSNITIGYILILLIIPYFLIQGWKKKIESLKQEIADLSSSENDKQALLQRQLERKNKLDHEISVDQNTLESMRQDGENRASTLLELLKKHYDDILNEQSKEVVESLVKWPPFKHHYWLEEAWQSWQAEQMEISSDLCIGHYRETKSTGRTYELPAYVPFIGRQKALFISGRKDSSPAINGLMGAMAIRIAMTLPHKVKFTFLDPAGFGKAFPISRQLETRESSGDVYRVLENVMDEMHRIINKYGLSDDRPFDYEPDNILVEQRFEFIFVADFPNQYDRRVIESLIRIANTGHTAGKYVILHHNLDMPLPREIDMSKFERKFELPIESLSVFGSADYEFVPDKRPSEEVKAQILDALKRSKPVQKKVEWEAEVAINEEDWWRHGSAESIETPVGRSGRSDKLNIWFGAKQNEGGRPCSHGMLGAMTGSGKSNLYHVLILGLAIRYSPKELAFYLIDGKDGVEFQPYKQLPHAQFVSLKSQPKLSRSILAELLEEKERRNSLFTHYQVNDYESFRKLEDVKEVLPRILLMVDEYQELFEEDKEGIASNHLLALAQQGRSAGIHMLLGSQRFGVVGMMHQSAIFGNIHLRIAMKMSLSDRQALTEFGRDGKKEIAECNLPGKAVVNDQSGDDGANKPGMVALMTNEERQKLLENLLDKAQAMEDLPVETITTNIFHGSEQPKLLDNPQLSYLVNHPQWLSDQEMQSFANKEVHEGGLGEISWFQGEKPVVGWLGQEFNVRGQTKVILRRRQKENLILTGDYNEARFGMLTGLLTSFALVSPPDKSQFCIIDKTIQGAPWNVTLKELKDELLTPLGCEVKFASKNKESEGILSDLLSELERRLQEDEDERQDFGNIYLCIADPDKFEALCQVPNKFGSMEDTELGGKLQEIYVKGPSVGIFTTLAVESVMSLFSVLSKRNLDYFRHRVALQMSEDDSFTFIKRREASKLQIEGKKPICGFYLDVSNNRHATFKAYCLGEDMTLQLKEICTALKTR